VQTLDAEAFVQSRAAPHLAEMERLRRRALLLYFVGGAAAVLGVVVLGGGSQGPSVPGFACLLVGFALLFLGASAQSKRHGTFKQVVLKQLLAAACPSLEYAPDACIPESLYRSSGLFRTSYDRYQGDDHVSGRIGSTDICFSELHTEYKTETKDSEGRKSTHWHTIFCGIFFVADFHKHFAGATFVLPDTAQGLLGPWLGQGLQALTSSHGEIVKLEDPRFEQAFVTYSSDQQEARYILSPSLMERMLELRDRFDVSTHFSFIDGRVHVALETGGSHFEPSLWRTGVSREELDIHLGLIRALVGIVEDLDLNQRIWTKD
jgi:hypothetical protein